MYDTRNENKYQKCAAHCQGFKHSTLLTPGDHEKMMDLLDFHTQRYRTSGTQAIEQWILSKSKHSKQHAIVLLLRGYKS